jgi:hypothetical protein
VSTSPVGRRPVDLDLIADYLEDLLPPEEMARVRRLVEQDPAWADTVAALTGARPVVASALSDYARQTPPMPAEVASRLDASLRDLTGADAPTTRSVVDLAAVRRKRSSRAVSSAWLAAAAVLVVVLAGVGFALSQSRQGGQGSADSGAVAGKAPAYTEQALPGVPSRPALSVTATGNDYSTLARHPLAPHPAFTPNNTRPGPASPGQAVTVAPELSPLLDPGTLNTCLSAVEAASGGTASGADFASYRGVPALIVTLSPDGEQVAVGGRCGQPGAGPDVIAHG